MNKRDLVDFIASSTKLSKSDATKALDAVFYGIKAALKKKEEVRLVGFGTFNIAERKATEGRNPRTGEKIKIPASRQPKFRAGKGLKEAIS